MGSRRAEALDMVRVVLNDLKCIPDPAVISIHVDRNTSDLASEAGCSNDFSDVLCSHEALSKQRGKQIGVTMHSMIASTPLIGV
jgi:hypothetical protein